MMSTEKNSDFLSQIRQETINDTTVAYKLKYAKNPQFLRNCGFSFDKMYYSVTKMGQFCVKVNNS